jgi:putative endonuclease
VQYYVYILANKPNGTLYIGRTDDLIKRTWQHKQKLMKGFTARYGVDKPVYFEIFDDPANMVKRERRLKTWKREWKIALIEEKNPDWHDLYEKIIK